MANKKKSMSKLRQIIKCSLAGHSKRRISNLCDISRNTLEKYLCVFQSQPYSFKELLKLSDDQLETLLGSPLKAESGLSDLYSFIKEHSESLRKTGITKRYLWTKYRSLYPDGRGYSQFCEHFGRYIQSQSLSYIFEHKAGDKLMCDFAGKRLNICDSTSGELIPVEILVCILPCSQLIYVKALASQQSADFLGGLGACLSYIGGVPQALVTDNLKPAVKRASKYDPEINRCMSDFAEHYNMAVLPTRAQKPKDKALVESAVNIVYRDIYAHLHDCVFNSIAQLNTAILPLLNALNRKDFQKKPGSRFSNFEDFEVAELRPLPNTAFELRKYQKAKVHPNCHVLLSEDKHHYSVPYTSVGKHVLISYTHQIVEIHQDFNLIATHQRLKAPHRYTTNECHLHPRHQYYKNWSKEHFIEKAEDIGPFTKRLIEQVFIQSKHHEQGFKLCQGLLNLTKKYTKEQAEDASQICLQYDFISYKKLEFILSLELKKLLETEESERKINHENIRGAEEYNN